MRQYLIYGGLRVKIRKNIDFLNLVVLRIPDYVEDDGKLVFIKNQKIGLKWTIENRCYIYIS